MVTNRHRLVEAELAELLAGEHAHRHRRFRFRCCAPLRGDDHFLAAIAVGGVWRYGLGTGGICVAAAGRVRLRLERLTNGALNRWGQYPCRKDKPSSPRTFCLSWHYVEPYAAAWACRRPGSQAPRRLIVPVPVWLEGLRPVRAVSAGSVVRAPCRREGQDSGRLQKLWPPR